MRYSPEPRRRSNRLLLLFLLLLLMAGGLLSLGVAYQVGAAQSSARVASLLNDLEAHRRLVSDLSARAARAEQELARLKGGQGATAPTSTASPTLPVEASTGVASSPAPAGSAPPSSAATSETAGGVPAAEPLPLSKDALQELVQTIQGRLAAGVPADRLVQSIAAVAAPAAPLEGCSAPVDDTRAFLARTPVTRDPSTIRLLGGRLRVKGSGVSVRASNGLPEAWFDPTQPVTVEIDADGTPSQLSGVLPLSGTVEMGGKTVRLAASVADKRGFISVTATSCP